MSRHNRVCRATRAAPPDDEECGTLPPRWFVAVFFTGAFTFSAVFASASVFLGAVQPLVAPLVYHSTDGVPAGYGAARPGTNWNRLGLHNGVLVAYEVDGRTYRCVASRHIEPVLRPARVLRVYYPADRPDRGFVCDWAGERRWRVSDWPLAAFCLPFLAIALAWYWMVHVLPWSELSVRSFARGVRVPFGMWFAGLFLGGAVGMLLIPDPKDMDHPFVVVVPQFVGGLVGGWWGLRRVGARAGGGGRMK